MTLAATSHDSASQRTIIAAGHNEKCQTYELKLAIENFAKANDNDKAGNNNSGSSLAIQVFTWNFKLELQHIPNLTATTVLIMDVFENAF